MQRAPPLQPDPTVIAATLIAASIMSSDEDDIELSEDEVEVKPRRRRRKKKKDPNRPKRNMSAFFLYSNANRERVKEENPEAKFGDIVSGWIPLCVPLLCSGAVCALALARCGGVC